MHLRVRPVDTPTVERIRERAAQAGRRQKAEALVDADAAVVAAATEKVLIGGDTEVTLKDLGAELGLPEGFALGDVIRAVCIRDGDVSALARAVGEVSGFTTGLDVLDAEFAGE